MAKSAKSKTLAKQQAAAQRQAQTDQVLAEFAAIAHKPGALRRRNHPTRSKDGYMQLLLTSSVQYVGKPGDLVRVRPGFARNYLIPKGLATFATPHNLLLVEKRRRKLQEIEEARLADLRNMAAQLNNLHITIEANANDEGYLYGSVNADQIAEAIAENNFTIEVDRIQIEAPLKVLGEYKIPIALAEEVEAQVVLWVIPPHDEESEDEA